MIKNATFMFASTVARLLTSVVLFVLLARAWGVQAFGMFTYAFALASLAAILIDYGFTLQVVREIGREPRVAHAVVHRAIGAKVWLTGVVLLAAAAGTPWIGSGEIRVVVWVLLLASIVNSFALLLNLPLRGLGQFQEEAWVSVLANVALFALIAALVILDLGPIAVACGFLAARVAYLWLSVTTYRRVVGQLTCSGVVLGGAHNALVDGLPYGIFVALGALYFQIDTLLLQHFKGPEAVGLYQAAARVLMAALVVPDVLSNVYLPAIAAVDSKGTELVRLGTRLTRHLLMLGVVGLWTLTALAAWLTRVLYGPDYHGVSMLLPWFGLVLLLRYLGSSLGLLLTVDGRQVARTVIVGLTCVVSVALNAILIPRAGVDGAVTASVLTHLFLVATYLLTVVRTFRTSFLETRSLLLLAVAALVVVTGQTSLTLPAIIVFAVTTIALGITWTEVERMARRLRRSLHRAS